MNPFRAIMLCLFLGFASCTVDPCLHKSIFIRQFENMTADVFENYKDYTTEDWERKDEKMDQFIGQCYEQHQDKLTEDEKKDLWIKYFKYKYYRHGKSVLSAIEADAREFSIQIDEELNTLFDNPEEDVRRILNELYGEDIEKALDDFMEGLNDIADKIKKWLNQE